MWLVRITFKKNYLSKSFQLLIIIICHFYVNPLVCQEDWFCFKFESKWCIDHERGSNGSGFGGFLIRASNKPKVGSLLYSLIWHQFKIWSLNRRYPYWAIPLQPYRTLTYALITVCWSSSKAIFLRSKKFSSNFQRWKMILFWWPEQQEIITLQEMAIFNSLYGS